VSKHAEKQQFNKEFLSRFATGENKMKKISIFFLAMLFSLLAMSFAMAAPTVTIIDPTANEIITATFLFNVTAPNSTGQATSNCTLSTTADGVFATNSSVNASAYLFSVDTTTLTEAFGTTLTATCANNTNGAGTATVTISIDNTAPTVNLYISDTKVATRTQRGMFADCSSEKGTSDTTLSSASYLITLTKPDGTTVTSTLSSDNFEDSDFDQVTGYTINCRVTDGASLSTTTPNQDIFASSRDDGLETSSIVTQQGQKVKSKNNTFFVFIVVVVFILIVGMTVSLLQTSKGKRRR